MSHPMKQGGKIWLKLKVGPRFRQERHVVRVRASHTHSNLRHIGDKIS